MEHNEWMNGENGCRMNRQSLRQLHMKMEDIFTNPPMMYQCSWPRNKHILRQPVTQALAVQFREEEEEEEARSIEKATAPRTHWLIYCICWAWSSCLSGLKNFSYQTCSHERPISIRFTGRNIMENWDVSARIRSLSAGEVSVDIEG